MKTIPTLTLAAIKMFFRNRQALFFTIVFPIILMGIFALVGFDKPPKVEVGVVTSHPNAGTQQFVDAIKNVGVFNVQIGSEEEEKSALQKGDLAAVIVVPDALIPDGPLPKDAQPQEVKVYTNVAQPQLAGATVSILNSMLNETNFTLTQTPRLFTIKTKEVASKNQKYLDFLLPGIVAMSIMQMAVFSVSFVFVEYKEKGILKRLLATPMRPYQFVTANVITRLLVALVQATILILLGMWAFQAQVIGSPLLLALIAILGGTMFLGLGFIISGIAKTEESVPALANIIVFPMLFLSGVFFPLSAMPEWLQHIVKYFPLSYFAHAMREVMANGASFFAIRTDLLWMGIWSVILIVFAVLTFRFEERRV